MSDCSAISQLPYCNPPISWASTCVLPLTRIERANPTSATTDEIDHLHGLPPAPLAVEHYLYHFGSLTLNSTFPLLTHSLYQTLCHGPPNHRGHGLRFQKMGSPNGRQQGGPDAHHQEARGGLPSVDAEPKGRWRIDLAKFHGGKTNGTLTLFRSEGEH